MSCGVGCRHRSDLVLLWLGYPIQPLTWEFPYAVGAALKSKKKKKKDQKKKIRVPLWSSGFGTWHCHCSGSGHHCGTGLILSPGTFVCREHSQKKKKIPEKVMSSRYGNGQASTLDFSCPRIQPGNEFSPFPEHPRP